MYYCPLKDRKGNDLTLLEIQYKHLSQLLNIEEGYKVEYKSLWDDSFKSTHLAQVITSFANTEGGWLFVGIKDNDGSITKIDRPRTDFGQQIAQIVKSKVSPYPTFEAKFISDATDKKKGVLVVYIHEGIEPPYICNGTVYVRVGSSKLPVKASDRAQIDNLVMKRNSYLDKMEKFCVNEMIADDFLSPYCTFYFYNRLDSLNLMIYEMWKDEEITKKFAKDNNFASWMISTDSILFFKTSVVSAATNTNILELFLNGSIKIYTPFFVLTDQVALSIGTAVNRKNPSILLDGFKALDGFLVHMGIKEIMRTAFIHLLDKKVNLNNVLLRVELKKIRMCYMYYYTDNGLWENLMCHDRFRYSSKEHTISREIPLQDVTRKNLDVMIEIYIELGVFSAFGLRAVDYLALSKPVAQKVKDFFGNKSFNSIDYLSVMYKSAK